MTVAIIRAHMMIADGRVPMPDSAYVNDPRVVWPASHSNFVAFLPDPDPAGAGRAVLDADGGFTVQGVVDASLTITHGWGYPRVFLTVDEALRAVLDEPIIAKIV